MIWSIGGGIKDAVTNYVEKTLGYVVDENQALLDNVNGAVKTVTIPAIKAPNDVGGYIWDKVSSAGMSAYDGALSAGSGVLKGVNAVGNSAID